MADNEHKFYNDAMRAQSPKPGFTSWNPLTGCTRISPGCKHCFAERISRNLQRTGVGKYANGFQLTLHGDDILNWPLLHRRPTLIFVNSMSDVFHKDVPEAFIRRIFTIVERTPWHRFMIFTKRADRLAEMSPDLPWPGNLWMAVSVENEDYRWRIDRLRTVPAAVRFISCEPLLGPIPDLDLSGIDSLACGAETGPNCRPCDPDWVRLLRDQCVAQNVPFAFHGFNTSADDDEERDRLIDGERWRQSHPAYRAFMTGGQMELF